MPPPLVQRKASQQGMVAEDANPTTVEPSAETPRALLLPPPPGRKPRPAIPPALVQRNAMKVWESDGQLSLLNLLKGDPDVTGRLDADELEALFDLDYHFKEVDTIFDRVFGAA